MESRLAEVPIGRMERPFFAPAYDFCSESLAFERIAFVGLRYKAQGERHSYCVSLVSTVLPSGGRRWWFKCPMKDVRVANLYLPPGATRFASRQAHNLTYRSCQESGRLARRVRRMAASISTRTTSGARRNS